MELAVASLVYGMMFVIVGVFFAIIDKKTENEILEHQKKKDEEKEKQGPSLVTKIIVADAVLDALDKKKDDKKK